MRTLYGIKNCDSVKKARNWLTQQQLSYQFHDYQVSGINAQLLNTFAQNLGWDVLINKRSTTWRSLSAAQTADLNPEKIRTLLLEYPTLIKRPILVAGDIFLIGFTADDYQRLL